MQINTVYAQAPLEDVSTIQMLDQLIVAAKHANCSDIHLEPQQQGYQIRFRVDGLLQLYQQINTALALRICARLKVQAGLDVAEKRRPQDGSIQDYYPIAIRVSTYPQLWGEKLVLRLQQKQQALALEHLGMSALQLAEIKRCLQNPHGAIIITGPTGSGKTITLYSLLAALNSIEKNIVSIEDPIEVAIPGMNQAAINPKAGLSFAKMLRGYLRQDPDVIMIGEIRDQCTAKIAYQAAQTGHKILTTLHAETAQAALARLQMLGVLRDVIHTSTQLIINQRLFRKLCQQCRGINTASCSACHATGYHGRQGIFQFTLLGPQQECDDALLQTEHEHFIQQLKHFIKRGLTSQAELQRLFGHF